MTLKQISDREQRDAEIEASYRKFCKGIRLIDEKHDRRLRWLDRFEAFMQGVIAGAVVSVIIVVVLRITKHL